MNSLHQNFDAVEKMIMTSPLQCPHCGATENISKQQLTLHEDHKGIIYLATARLLCEGCGNTFKFELKLNIESRTPNV